MNYTLDIIRESDGVVCWAIEELEIIGETKTIPIALIEARGVLMEGEKFTTTHITDRVESRGN